MSSAYDWNLVNIIVCQLNLAHSIDGFDDTKLNQFGKSDIVRRGKESLHSNRCRNGLYECEIAWRERRALQDL